MAEHEMEDLVSEERNEKRLEEVEGSVVEVGTDSGLTENV